MGIEDLRHRLQNDASSISGKYDTPQRVVRSFVQQERSALSFSSIYDDKKKLWAMIVHEPAMFGIVSIDGDVYTSKLVDPKKVKAMNLRQVPGYDRTSEFRMPGLMMDHPMILVAMLVVAILIFLIFGSPFNWIVLVMYLGYLGRVLFGDYIMRL